MRADLQRGRDRDRLDQAPTTQGSGQLLRQSVKTAVIHDAVASIAVVIL
jgi:hypothetical protein